mmetsp:Transcript_1303/g.1854  ORF Transcript_1303/g.1854 Transcript_1303/m.1854 type:complete len:233 (+) Transcript_1303:103-801(+)|eukprot:CAMPEP_0167758284 /NCGR_PEP_ID=MMETSP0110_2-20121227/10383_1 /TAXON_ID=629695 /ORGANISM="Gymnochlora sp., Strain CCMP2014" /LENGTH=232 /DNA_ID=CAMNT_0007644543 /DNA_START=84 /DNA_END=782 /DNA_ORIENTATION=+
MMLSKICRRAFSTVNLRNPKIIAFSGSARADSVNQKLVRLAAAIAAEQDADVTILEPADFPIPLYNQDLEAKGFPENALAVRAMLAESDGFLIASPEYNGFFSPMLKNLIDWCSRPVNDEKVISAVFKGKVAGIMAASPGGLGGLRGLPALRELLVNLGVDVVPDQVAVGGAFKAFGEDGKLSNEMHSQMLETCVHQVVKTSRMWANEEAACSILKKIKENPKLGEYGSVTL